MMRLRSALTILALLALAEAAPRGPSHQHVLGNSAATTPPHIISALEQFEDPVDAMLALDPAQAYSLAERRYLEVFDGPERSGRTRWLTEGDKLRLRRANIDFIDWTGRDLVDPDHQATASELHCHGSS